MSEEHRETEYEAAAPPENSTGFAEEARSFELHESAQKLFDSIIKENQNAHAEIQRLKAALYDRNQELRQMEKVRCTNSHAAANPAPKRKSIAERYARKLSVKIPWTPIVSLALVAFLVAMPIAFATGAYEGTNVAQTVSEAKTAVIEPALEKVKDGVENAREMMEDSLWPVIVAVAGYYISFFVFLGAIVAMVRSFSHGDVNGVVMMAFLALCMLSIIFIIGRHFFVFV